MEKTARKPSADPAQERLRQNKANWNKEVSAFINDLIHFKKMMNGWPSKFFKERSRITQPIPADPATIIGSLAGDFQELATKGNSVIQEQVEYAKIRRQNQPKPAAARPTGPSGPAPETPKPDLTRELGKGLPTAASSEESEIIKLAFDLESKYELAALASNPFSRFITRLFNPKFGFGEGARVRRLRMTMLDYCVKSYKELKRLHKEVVKSGKTSITVSHKIMTGVWNYWNAVNRLFATFKTIKPEAITDDGGEIEDSERKKEKSEEVKESNKPLVTEPTMAIDNGAIAKLKDYQTAFRYLGSLMSNQSFNDLHSILESITAATKDRKLEVLQNSNVNEIYAKALKEANQELGTSGSSFQEIAAQMKNQPSEKTAQLQRYLGKTRHQLVPGVSSGQRLEIYNFITQIRRDLDNVMNLLEKGFEQEQLTMAIGLVNREMTGLRTMMRSLYYAEKPEEASSPFF